MTPSMRILLLITFAFAFFVGHAPFLFGATPSDVIRDIYRNCNEGEYSRVEPLLSSDYRKMMHTDSRAVAGGGVKRMCDEATRRGTLVGVDILKETIRGEGATVVANARFKTGAPAKEVLFLVKENGAWRFSGGE